MSNQSTSLPDLQFNVSGLLKGPVGSTRSHDLYVPVSELDQLDEGFDVTGPFTGAVRFFKTADTVVARGQGETTVRLECSRCLDTFDAPVALTFEEEFYPTVDINSGRKLASENEDEALLIDEHHILDLSEVVRQEILLALPITMICRPDCAGLCPICGVNRNLQTCQCVDTSTDPRWAALSVLLDIESDES